MPGCDAESAVSLGKIGERRAVEPLEAAVRPYYETAPTDTNGVTISTGPMDEKVRMTEREGVARSRFGGVGPGTDRR